MMQGYATAPGRMPAENASKPVKPKTRQGLIAKAMKPKPKGQKK